MKSAENTARLFRLPNWPDQKRQHELEFLPAALEIVETPASPIGRAIIGLLALFFMIAVGWAWVGEIDIISTATGKIVPTGRVKVIQPFETGVVRAIHVHDGDSVTKGDVLVELDPTINAAESGRFREELLASELQVARLRALLGNAANLVDGFVAPDGASQAQIALQGTLLINQSQEIKAKLANLDRQIAESEATLVGTRADVQKLKLSIPLLQQRVTIFKTLFDDGWGQKPQYLELEQTLIEHQQDLQAENAKTVETTAHIAALQEQRNQTWAEFRRTNLSDLADAEQKAASLREQLVQAEQRRKLQTLSAPVDGTVQQVAVHTVGGVVTPAQQLLIIVPADSRLEIDALVANKDIGFVHEGQLADIKIDTFNFTKYGLLHGQVLNVSQDAIARDKTTDNKANGTAKPITSDDDSSEPRGQELVYATRVSLDSTQMSVDGKLVNLSPGMAVTVEIKTGKRHVIEYLLSPLLRYKQESLRER
jgi:hemolysin D